MTEPFNAGHTGSGMPEPGHINIEGYLFGEASPEAALHLERCARCREEVESLRQLEQLLGEVPEEFLLDGPPPDADLVLARTLGQVRRETSQASLRSRALLVGAAAVAVVLALAAGVFIGGRTPGGGGENIAIPTTAPEVPGTRTATATDPQTGAEMVATITPAAGWVRLAATVRGIPAGEPCYLVVVGTDGRREIAGGWLVSERGATEGTTLSGSALIAPDEVAAVVVENLQGRQFVTVRV